MNAFRAHRAEVDQTGFPLSVYSQVLFTSTSFDPAYSATGYDTTGRFSLATSLWTPVASGEPNALVQFSGQVWTPNPGALNSGVNIVCRIIKNSATFGISIGAAIGTKDPFEYGWVCNLAMQDIASAGDAYGVYLYTNAPGTKVDGNSLHTFFSGAVVG